jgi:hypothetical protein
MPRGSLMALALMMWSCWSLKGTRQHRPLSSSHRHTSYIQQVHPAQVKRNGGAEEGDVLILSKPIGVGVLSAALKKGMLSDAGYATLLKWTCKVGTSVRVCASVAAWMAIERHMLSLNAPIRSYYGQATRIICLCVCPSHIFVSVRLRSMSKQP